jgi:VIT1/CCC1 family predicted Fe2+/Mn2+ transporter
MEQITLDEKTSKILATFQKNEITEYHIYSKLAKRIPGKNGEVLQRIADDEYRHHKEWEKISGRNARPNRLVVFFYLLTAKVLGITFAVKMMERNEEKAEKSYSYIESRFPEASEIIKEEHEHEILLVNMIDEEKIGYIGSIVLGLNDALVELTGALAGLTLALQNTKVIGLAGLITGIAASFSMAASEYLSQKSESHSKDPLKASVYTGFAYIMTVILLVLPYFVLGNYYIALAFTLSIAVCIILVFAQFVSVVKEIQFKKFFFEMILLSFGVAAISFFIGWLARAIFNIEL